MSEQEEIISSQPIVEITEGAKKLKEIQLDILLQTERIADLEQQYKFDEAQQLWQKIYQAIADLIDLGPQQKSDGTEDTPFTFAKLLLQSGELKNSQAAYKIWLEGVGLLILIQKELLAELISDLESSDDCFEFLKKAVSFDTRILKNSNEVKASPHAFLKVIATNLIAQIPDAKEGTKQHLLKGIVENLDQEEALRISLLYYE